jgi:LmbE family N-acetylglucosaminyl deacetylase
MLTLEPGAPLRVLVVSPHLDDAVFACGDLLASYRPGVVVTVFAGAPRRYGRLTDWDQSCGFAQGDDVVAARRAEDRAALAILGARPIWLDFLDAQYGPSPSPGDIAAALAQTIEAEVPSAVFFPLGLFHSDHQLVHAACLDLMPRQPQVTWFVYEDALYRASTDQSHAKRADLGAAGYTLHDAGIAIRHDRDLKQRAAAQYASQLRGLVTPGRPGVADLTAPERYWRVMPNPVRRVA